MGGAGWWVDVGREVAWHEEERSIRVVEGYHWLGEGTVNEAEAMAAYKLILAVTLVSMIVQDENWKSSRQFADILGKYLVAE